MLINDARATRVRRRHGDPPTRPGSLPLERRPDRGRTGGARSCSGARSRSRYVLEAAIAGLHVDVQLGSACCALRRARPPDRLAGCRAEPGGRWPNPARLWPRSNWWRASTSIAPRPTLPASTRAELLRRLDRVDEARAAYDPALELVLRSGAAFLRAAAEGASNMSSARAARILARVREIPEVRPYVRRHRPRHPASSAGCWPR